jgi:hypothetical protein
VSDQEKSNVPFLLWPFYAIWRFATFILKLVGRILCAVIGLALMFVGVTVTISVVAAPIGVPIVALGFLLLIRALF